MGHLLLSAREKRGDVRLRDSNQAHWLSRSPMRLKRNQGKGKRKEGAAREEKMYGEKRQLRKKSFAGLRVRRTESSFC